MSELIPTIDSLELSSTFYDWFIITNELVESLNPLNLYDIEASDGLSETRSGGNVVLKVEPGKAIKNYAVSGLQKKITLDIVGLSESVSGVSNDSYFVYETGNQNYLYKTKASNILPPTVDGNHIFSGSITIEDLFVNDKNIFVNYGANTNTPTDDAGLILRPKRNDSSKDVKWTYNSTLDGWESNRNIVVKDGYGFYENSESVTANFDFHTSSDTDQVNVALNLYIGPTDNDWWSIKSVQNGTRLDFIYNDATNTSPEETRALRIQKEISGSTVIVEDAIWIKDIAGSSNNFLQETDYSRYKVPYSNANGLLDSKWVNRIVVTNYEGSIVAGDVVRLYNYDATTDNTNVDDTVRAVRATADGTTQDTHPVIGIVEYLSGGNCYIVVNGEFEIATGSYYAGYTYYLSQSSAGKLTSTKPTTGEVLPIFVATSYNTGVLLSSGGGSSGYRSINVGQVATPSSFTDSDTITSSESGSVLYLAKGTGIDIYRTTSGDKSVLVIEATGATSSIYSQYRTEYYNSSGSIVSGLTVAPTNSSAILKFRGANGITINGYDSTNETTQDIIQISGPNTFTGIEVLNDNTGYLDFDVNASNGFDLLRVVAGTGIAIEPDGSGFKIIATGEAIGLLGFTNKSRVWASRYDSSGQFEVNMATYSEDPSNQKLLSTSKTVNGNSYECMLFGRVYNTSISAASSSPNFVDFTNYSVRDMRPLSSSDLANIILNNEFFRRLQIYSPSGTLSGTITPPSMGTDKIQFKGSSGIVTSVDGTTQYQVNFTFDPSASGIYAFSRIRSSTSGILTDADAYNDTLWVADTSTIQVFVGTTNDSMTWNVKDASITNSKLAAMTTNSVKATQSSMTPNDVQISTNNVLGRMTGSLKSLTGSELRQILELGTTIQNQFYDRVVITSGASVTYIDTNYTPGIPAIITSNFGIKAGSNITLSVEDDTEGNPRTVVINSVGGGGGTNGNSLSTIQTTTTVSTAPNEANLNDTVTINDGIGNISFYSAYDSLGLSLDSSGNTVQVNLFNTAFNRIDVNGTIIQSATSTGNTIVPIRFVAGANIQLTPDAGTVSSPKAQMTLSLNPIMTGITSIATGTIIAAGLIQGQQFGLVNSSAIGSITVSGSSNTEMRMSAGGSILHKFVKKNSSTIFLVEDVENTKISLYPSNGATLNADLTLLGAGTGEISIPSNEIRVAHNKGLVLYDNSLVTKNAVITSSAAKTIRFTSATSGTIIFETTNSELELPSKVYIGSGVSFSKSSTSIQVNNNFILADNSGTSRSLQYTTVANQYSVTKSGLTIGASTATSSVIDSIAANKQYKLIISASDGTNKFLTEALIINDNIVQYGMTTFGDEDWVGIEIVSTQNGLNYDIQLISDTMTSSSITVVIIKLEINN
jgi:hypothetical protein